MGDEKSQSLTEKPETKKNKKQKILRINDCLNYSEKNTALNENSNGFEQASKEKSIGFQALSSENSFKVSNQAQKIENLAAKYEDNAIY